MSFHVGQLVVCVDEDFIGGRPDTVRPRKGTVYTIREFHFSEWYGQEHVRLHEIRNPPVPYYDGYYEASWSPHHFRPVDDKRIEIFRQIATSPRKRIEVDA